MKKMVFKIGMVGAGTMGSGIAQKMAQEGLNVVLVDVGEAQLERGMGMIRGTLQEAIDRKILTQKEVDVTLSRIKPTVDKQELKDCDLIVEAVFEDLKVKQDLFAELDKICDEKTILASNTSSFYISDLAKATNRPDRVIGMHYFFHPAKNRLLKLCSRRHQPGNH